jgi:hypothetical protein
VTLAACIIDGILMMAIISIALLLSKEFQVVNEIKVEKQNWFLFIIAECFPSDYSQN